MPLRKALFWIHLIAGCVAGAVVLIMSVTGVLLTYERQMIEWSDREFTSKPQAGTQRLGPEAILAAAQAHAKAAPASILMRSSATAPAEVVFGRDKTLLIDVYSGQVLGEASKGMRSFMRGVTDWHRWLAAQGQSRPTGRAVTGASNLAFLFLIITGLYIWLPRRLRWQNIRPIVWFRGGLAGKAREFNWHNTIGIWCAVPLFFIVLGGVVISYPWATNLLYAVTGSTPPPAPARPAPGPGPGVQGGAEAGERRDNRELQVAGLNTAWQRAAEQQPEWQSITARFAGPARAPFTLVVDGAHRGRPDRRVTLTVDRASGEVLKAESMASYNAGRKIRTWLRWIHTGEAGGVVGQTIAGLASLGAAFLVYTGIALSVRRFLGWRKRHNGGGARRRGAGIETGEPEGDPSQVLTSVSNGSSAG